MGRYFVAVVPQGLNENPELKQLLSKMKRTWRERDREIRWVHPDLWHVTLQFLGDLTPELHQQLLDLLREWQPSSARALVLRFHGVGAFPAPDQARVLWVGVGENQQFLDMQGELATFLRSSDFVLDSRVFHPHLTLARLRNPQSVNELVELGGRKHFGDYAIGELVLFESVLQGNILKYVPVFRRGI